MVRVRWQVHGRVQGVGFRYFVREEARTLGIAGWVRNDQDGSVELAAEGSPDAIERFRARVAAGPPGAAVRTIEPRPDDGAPLPHPFAIHR